MIKIDRQQPIVADFIEDKNQLLSCQTCEKFLADFLGCGVNMADSDEEAAVAFLGPVA